MSLNKQIMEDMKQAMKDKNAEKLVMLRLLRSEIKNVEIDHGEQDDAGVQKIVAKLLKQWNDAKSDYEKGGRDDLVKEAESKIVVLESYLPEQMSDDELKKIVKEVIDQSGQTQVGPIIGQVMKKVAGKADGGKVSQLVKELLA